ncbi:hypothetical protein [Streptomyces sp. NPDC059894]|uniref:hypothetical protein n=1 Tax=unclassified Streptomyces TaxID=2593676 RepID=UPI00364F1E52
MTETQSDDTSRRPSPDTTLELLRALFQDRPGLLRAVTLGDLEGRGVVEEIQSHDRLFGLPVYQFAVGQTGAGKTSLGNLLFGERAMRSTGYQDCTDYIGMLRLRSDLWYFDTPGAGGDEQYENFARLALGLEQIRGRKAESFELLDFTDASLEGEKVVGVLRTEVAAADRDREFGEKYPPDVIVYLVVPQRLFLRPDQDYLRDMLERYGDKVVVALNTWESATRDVDVLNVRRQITSVYQDVFGTSVEPRFVQFDALSGTGVHDLTRALCQVIAPEKLGGMQAVLDGDLKEHARRERSLHYRRTVNRIAARLALNTVDQQAGNQDLVAVAAKGVSQFGVLTFEAGAAAAALRDALADLVDREARSVREKQSEKVVTKDLTTRKRDIVTKEPQFDLVETTRKEKKKITREVENVTGTGFLNTLKEHAKATVDQIDNALGGGGWEKHDALRERARRNSVHRTTSTVHEEVEVPVTEIRQKVVGYQEKVLATVEEVVDVTERVIGTKALKGGLPVIELLLSVGTGVEAYCLAEDGRDGIDTYVERERQRIAIVLDRAEPQLSKLLRKGHDAEEEIAVLLDRLLATS